MADYPVWTPGAQRHAVARMRATLRTRDARDMPYRTIEVLLVGTQRLPDGRTVTFDRARIARICRQANAQLRAGIRSPCAWMHDPEAGPVHLSQSARLHPEAWLARGYFGEPEKYVQDAATGNLLAKVWVHDEKDARQFDRVGQVSPALWQDWVDEQGVHWPELTIAHIAATPKPIQRHIGRTTKYPATYLSQPARAKAAIQLSFPATPRSEPMADDNEMMESEGGEGGESLSPEHIQKIIDMLAKHGLKLADGIDDADDLLLALESASMTLTGEDHAEPDADQMGGESDGDADNTIDMDKFEEVPAPVLMSHPLVRKWSQMAGKAAHDERLNRLKKCLADGKITKAMFDKDVKELSAINLSQPTADTFAADGSVKPTRLDLKLEVYESLPGVATQGGKSGTVNLSHPVEAVKNPVLVEADEKRAQFLKELEENKALKAVNAGKK